MIDEDEVSLFETTPHFQASLEQALADAQKLDLPFDLKNIADYNPFIYGELGEGPLLGQHARFTGFVNTLEGRHFDVGEGIGQIVGHFAGRVVLAFECEEHGFLYLGWLNPEEIELVTIHFPETQKWMH